MKIVLIRHGETKWNQELRLQGKTDIPLSPEGIEQMKAAGEILRQKLPFSIDCIVSSPLIRAIQTAEILSEALGLDPEAIQVEPLFIERCFGAGEGMRYEEARAKYPDDNFPGMETLEELRARAEAAIAHCAACYPDRNVLVTSHGAMIRGVLMAASKGAISYFDKRYWIHNGSYCILEQTEDGWDYSFEKPISEDVQAVI